jgi:NADH pyrophosphatase NudC (nudix superfamily)
MFPLFGILHPQTGPEGPSAEAPRKKSFFSPAVDPAVIVAIAEQDALYLAGKQSEPEVRNPYFRDTAVGRRRST